MVNQIEHLWSADKSGINSGLCECGYHGEIISSRCTCGKFHSWCIDCWDDEWPGNSK